MSITLKQAAQQALDALVKSKNALEVLWVSHHANRTDYAIEDIDSAIEALRTAIQQAGAQQPATPEPVAWVSKTGHGTYFRESITPELASLEHGGRKMWRPLTYADNHPATGVPDGWRIEEKGGDIIVRKDGFGGYSARKNTESIAEAVLHELALDLLAASPAQKGGE